jgi:hypothetical protein
MSKPKPTLSTTISTIDADIATAAGAVNISLGTFNHVDTRSYYEWQLDNIPEDVLKEYYLRKYTKLGRKLNGEE